MRRLLIYPNGDRIVAEDGIVITTTNHPPETIIDLDTVSEEAFEAVKASPHDEKLLTKLIDTSELKT